MFTPASIRPSSFMGDMQAPAEHHICVGLGGSWLQYLMDDNIVQVQSVGAVAHTGPITRALVWLRDLYICLMFTALWGMASSP